jgi:hypothetical protein
MDYLRRRTSLRASHLSSGRKKHYMKRGAPPHKKKKDYLKRRTSLKKGLRERGAPPS